MVVVVVVVVVGLVSLVFVVVGFVVSCFLEFVVVVVAVVVGLVLFIVVGLIVCCFLEVVVILLKQDKKQVNHSKIQNKDLGWYLVCHRFETFDLIWNKYLFLFLT